MYVVRTTRKDPNYRLLFLNQWIDKKNIQTILKILNINVGVLFPTSGFQSSGLPPGGGSRGHKNPKMEKIGILYNTIKIIVYNFVIIFYKNVFKKIQ